MIVIDASAMVELLLGTELGQRVDGRVLARADSRHAPHLLDVEVAHVLRRLIRMGDLTGPRASVAIEDLGAFPLRRHAHTPLLERVFELRANLSAYDATYLALAEAIGATFVTCDVGLAKVPGLRVPVEVVR